MVAHLTRIFGLGRLDLAEDVVQDTLCRALEIWPVHGLPDNPSAWLMRVARNRAIDLLRRDGQLRFFAPELIDLLRPRDDQPGDMFSLDEEIKDDQLRMMFSCCHPHLSTEAQVTLILRTLCGFSVSEIAHALLAGEDAIEKRLGRARHLFRRSGSLVDIAETSDISNRLHAVHQAVYLLFNEGYHGSDPKRPVREDLCVEAIRLALLLTAHPKGDTPQTSALLALMCFHAARLPGRVGDDGGLIQLQIQDRSRWDRDLIGRGFHYLDKASAGTDLSEYHLEAGIAALHCAASTYEKTDWTKIVKLYEMLSWLRPSPVVALNRAVALGNAEGPEQGLTALRKIPDASKLKGYPFFPAAQGELHLLAGRPAEAEEYFEQAKRLARSPSETNFFERKRQACRQASAHDGRHRTSPRVGGCGEG